MSRLPRFLPIALAIGSLTAAGAAGAATDVWNAARWHALFDQTPMPPAALARAGAMIGATRDDKGDRVLGPIDPALVRSYQDRLAGMAAMNTAVGHAAAASMGVVATRLRDPANAAQLQQQMASMSQAQKIQMAMRMGAMEQATRPAMNMPALRAAGALQSYVIGDAGRSVGARRRELQAALQRLTVSYDSRHASLDRQLADLLKRCPPIPRSSNQCGDTDCSPQPACVAGINARVPALIAAHRQLAAVELAEERKLFADTRATLQPVMARTASLAAAVEATGGGADRTQPGYALLNAGAAELQTLTAVDAVRTGYWQNIRQRTQPDSYFVVGNLGYQYRLGADDVLQPPTHLPSGW